MKFPLIHFWVLRATWVLLVLLGLGLTGFAQAEKADRNKPMNIEADNLRQDDLKQISVFTGRVVLTRGTIIIRGGQLTVRQDPQGYQYATVVAEAGKQAFFRQKREGVDEYMEGEGDTIEYDGRADTVKFIKRAQLRRFIGATLNDEMTGGIITYDNTTEVFSIDGGAATNAASGTGAPALPAGRVRAVLTPKPQNTASQPKPSATPATPALRVTPALEVEKK